MRTELRERHETADTNTPSLRLDQVETPGRRDPLEIDEDIRRRQVVLEHSQQVAASPDDGSARAGRVETLYRLGQGPRIDIRETSHASASRTRARVIGSSLIRRPVALKTALPMAATTGMTGGSPTFFAPYGPKASSGSMK